MSRLKSDAPSRSVVEIGPGDFVKVGSTWEQVIDNSAFRADHAPRTWTVRTRSGERSMWDINRYAKDGDLENP